MMENDNVTRTEISVATNHQAVPGNVDTILVTYADRINVTTASQKPLSWVVEQIRCSDYLREQIAKIRKLATQEERQAYKKATLPWFSFAGYRDDRRLNEAFQSTKFILVDCDHIGAQLPDMRKRIVADPEVFLCFVSPSGDGLKVAFEMKNPITSVQEYRTVFGQFRNLVTARFGGRTDDDEEPARACYLSSDPLIYVNPNRICVTPPKLELQLEKPQVTGEGHPNVLSALAGSASPGRTHKATQIIGFLIHKDIPEFVTKDYLCLWDKIRNTPPLGEAKITTTVRDMYKRYGDSRVADVLMPYYSYRTEIFDVGLVGEEFFLEDIGPRKFFIRTGAHDKETQEKYLDYLVRHKHIRHLLRIDHMGEASVSGSFIEFDEGQGLFRVHYAPCTVGVQDNGFVETWLSEAFGPHRTFIKQWLAVYCYTNYRKLPTLVLKGDRSTGKNTFAEAVLSIYPSISQFWHGEEKNFTPEVQKKLLIADESVSANEKQYRLLKQRSGQKMAPVNQKFQPEYQVRNNMNIIILSNDVTPIFVQKDEEPTSVKNNQFFVYTMPKFKGEIDPDFGQKIEDRLGHYVCTELKTIYEAVKNIPGCRYSIPTPITDEERALFNVNQTGLEEEGMKFLRKMVEREDSAYAKFFDKGFFPTSFFDEYFISKGYSKNGVIRNLKEKDYLEPKDSDRKMVAGRREFCFTMTDKLKKWYQEQLLAQ